MHNEIGGCACASRTPLSRLTVHGVAHPPAQPLRAEDEALFLILVLEPKTIKTIHEPTRHFIPEMRASPALLILAAGVVVVAWSSGGGRLGRGSVLIEVEGNPMGTIPSISSSCITGNKACVVAVPGGSLRLTSITFPDGPGAPGAADAVGYVNGRFVSGTIQLSAQPVHAADKDDQSPEALEKSGPPAAVVKQAWRNGPPAVQLRQKQLRHPRQGEVTHGLRPVSGLQKLADADHDKAAEEQYNAALAAVEGHMKERMDKVEEEATKIAEAVTRVITSPEVSKKIADLAMDAAAARAGPASEASETGGVQGGVDGVSQFGYSDQPAGVVGAGCGPGCAGMTATTPDLETVLTGPPPPSSTAFYAAWKASGGQTGSVPMPAPAPQVIVMNNNVTQSPWPAVGQPLMPYTLNAAMMGASGFVHGEPLPEDSVSVEPVGGAAETSEAQERAVPVQLHQMNEIGASPQLGALAVSRVQAAPTVAPSEEGGGLMAQMQAILSSPGGASAAAQYQQRAQMPTLVQAAAAATQQGTPRTRRLSDPWGAFSAFQNGSD